MARLFAGTGDGLLGVGAGLLVGADLENSIASGTGTGSGGTGGGCKRGGGTAACDFLAEAFAAKLLGGMAEPDLERVNDNRAR